MIFRSAEGMPVDPSDRRRGTFVCHSSDDKEKVRELCRRFRRDGIEYWLDEERLLPGMNWSYEIEEAMRRTRYVLICLTAAIRRAGFVHEELNQALDLARQQPEGSVFLIPVRLEPCEIPASLRHLHCVDYFQETGYLQLLEAIRAEPADPTDGKPDVRPLDHPRPVLRVWDPTDGRELGAEVPTHIHRFSSVATVERADRRPLAVTIDTNESNGGSVGTPRVVIGVLRSGQLVAAATDGAGVHLWDLLPADGGAEEVARPFRDPLESRYVVDMAAVCGSDGRAVLAVGGHSGGLRFWDLNGPTLIREDRAVQVTALAATVTPDGRGYFVGGCHDTGMRVWDARSTGELPRLKRERSAGRTERRKVLDLAVAHIDGRLVAVTARQGDEHLRRWLLGSDDVADIPESKGSVTALALSTATERPAVIAAGDDRLLHVIDLDSGRPVAGSSMPLPGVIRAVSCLRHEPAAVVAGDDMFALVRWGPRGGGRSRLAWPRRMSR